MISVLIDEFYPLKSVVLSVAFFEASVNENRGIKALYYLML